MLCAIHWESYNKPGTSIQLISKYSNRQLKVISEYKYGINKYGIVFIKTMKWVLNNRVESSLFLVMKNRKYRLTNGND